ncbi:hypothetical protein V9T40_006547 [Parthenolecanium corni]|uniref:PEHE domain-containing protein n=1 Tax=Parthenolecanium corni TaxID=536013 RepID=A0AAN9Y687_9HEMI
MVRFVEEAPNSSARSVEKAKLNSDKTIDQKPKKSGTVFFLKTLPDELPLEVPFNEPNEDEESDPENGQMVDEKRKLKIPILTTSETYFTSVKEDTSHLYDAVTYKPTALEVPSFRIVEKDNIRMTNVPKDYLEEDIRIEASKERHLRFETEERKRKKWDVQRIRELRRNERLKETLRRRNSRWSDVEPPKQKKTENTTELITSLFPNIRAIEKIIITDPIPVTALGTSIPQIPSW